MQEFCLCFDIFFISRLETNLGQVRDKSWTVYKQIVDRLETNLGQVRDKSWTVYKQIVDRLETNRGQARDKSWTVYRQYVDRLETNRGLVRDKSWTVSVFGFTIVAEAGPATERTTDLSFRCDVSDMAPEDELLKVAWFYYDQQVQNFVEIFSADLTSDVPGYFFADNWSGRAIYEPTGVGNIILPAKFVTKEFIGDYRCQVNSLLSKAVASVKVDVFYGPGTSIVTTPGGRVEKREGDSLTLTCTAQCNPLCAYRWYKAGKKVSDEAILEMTSLADTDAGLYACQARNDAGRSIKPVDLRIFYRASVISFNISGVIQDSKTGIQTLVDSNNGVMANCEVRGWPEASIDWFKDGVSILKVNSTVVTQVDLDKKHGSYEFKSATCLENGEYTCQASNGVDNPVEKTAVLNIGCSPFETNRSTKCQPGSEVDTVINMNEMSVFYLCFYGYPEPMATVVTDEGDASNEHVYNLNVKCHKHERHCEAELQLNITEPRHYGRYQAKISNPQGYLYKKYNIISQQPPVSPTYFRVVNSTQSSACLTWDAQFNGGSKQTYSLRYRPKNRPVVSQTDEDSYAVSLIEDDETSADTLRSYTSCISNLIPSCDYEVILSTSNKYGRSKHSKNISFTTLSETIDLGDRPVKSWLQRLNPDPKISVHGDEFPDGENSDSGGENAELIVKPATPKRHQSFPFKEIITKSPANPKHRHKGSHDQNKDNDDKPPDHDDDDDDDGDDDSFFQLFDSFFALDALTDLNSSGKPKAFANFSAHIRKLVNSYARVHQNGSRHNSLNKLSLPTDPVGKSEAELTT
ncbi:hypothetical protein Btru_074343 [Bulinus truncatus]|nr:hypothetical protein Btru_074343 [Bulinus truncatus]